MSACFRTLFQLVLLLAVFMGSPVEHSEAACSALHSHPAADASHAEALAVAPSSHQHLPCIHYSEGEAPLSVAQVRYTPLDAPTRGVAVAPGARLGYASNLLRREQVQLLRSAIHLPMLC